MPVSTVAHTIAEQIGHKAFVMMGTRSKVADDDSLTFDIRGSAKWNKVQVTLKEDDTYTVSFYNIGKAPHYRVTGKDVTGVYADNLHNVIESQTGLCLSL